MHIHPVIYLDYNATTPVAPEVMNEMLPYFLSQYGNASSNDHIMGWQAREAVDNATESLARDLVLNDHKILYTAGATESINMVLRGFRIPGKTHIITVKTEHSAVLETFEALENDGFALTYLDVDETGLINLAELEASITANTLLVCIMWVNNETGVLQPMEAISRLCQKYDVPLMSDATQAIGKLKIDLSSIPIDFILGSAHKIYGPKGIGFLALKKSYLKYLSPIITGGGQEGGKRAGTTNVPAIIGLSRAVQLAYEKLTIDTDRIRGLRDLFENKLLAGGRGWVNGSIENRLYNTSNFFFKGVDSERLMQAIGHKLAASRGSACSTGEIAVSHVLSAMGLSNEDAHSSIRFSFGRYSTEDEVKAAVNYIISSLDTLSRS